MTKQVINSGESGLIVRGKINANFTELYTGKDSVTVANFAALPLPVTAIGERYWALASQGVFLVNRKAAGAYYSDGVVWTWLGDNPTTASQMGFVPVGALVATEVQAAIEEVVSDQSDINATLVPTNRNVATTAPLQGGGALSASLNISISAASGAAAGSMSASDKTKLDGVATAATANSSDATLLARANHTGTQPISSILAAATARIFGRITAAGGSGEELTGTQATTLLDVFTSVLKGLVPASGGGTTNFLRADGTWATPSGGSGVAARGVHATQPLLTTGNFTTNQVTSDATGTTTFAANRLDYCPFIPVQDVVVDRIDVEVSAVVAASFARLAIYSDTSGSPGALLRDGTLPIDCAIAGLKSATVSSVTLSAGTVYWLAVLSSSTQTFRGVAVGALMPMLVDATLNTTYVHKRQTQTYASGMPATASGLSNISGVFPLVKLRIG